MESIGLLDHFAGLAMRALITAGFANSNIEELAYQYASAMLVEREKYIKPQQQIEAQNKSWLELDLNERPLTVLKYILRNHTPKWEYLTALEVSNIISQRDLERQRGCGTKTIADIKAAFYAVGLKIKW